MTRQRRPRGFTLVELAIVMTIIGLLVGGILKGRQMIIQAKITRQIKDLSGMSAAAFAFYDKYAAWPGDFATAELRLANCTLENNCAAGDGNSIVGPKYKGNNYLTGYSPTLVDEQTQFWRHLSLAEMLSGIANTGKLAWGESHPASPFGGGFHVFYHQDGFGQFVGHQLYLRNVMDARPWDYWRAKGHHPMWAAWVAQIDRKIDDGNGDRGIVQSYPSYNSCGIVGGKYDELSFSRDCTMQYSLMR